MRRIQRHLVLASSTLLLFAVAAGSGPASNIEDRLSIVSAYVCLTLLGYTLLIGPAQLMKTGRPVVNIYLRRDIGIWAAAIGLLHFVLANKLSMNSAYIDHFVNLGNTPPLSKFVASFILGELSLGIALPWYFSCYWDCPVIWC